MRIDYKTDKPRRRLPHRYRLLSVISVVAAGVILAVVSGSGNTGQPTGRIALDLPIPEPTLVAPTDSEPYAHDGGEIHAVTVRNGDSLASIFSELGIPATELHRMMTGTPGAQRMIRIHPGDELHIVRDDAGTLVSLEYPMDEVRTLHIMRKGEAYDSYIIDNPPERRIQHAQGVIDSSLFLAARDAGLSDNLTMRLAAIFGWDIDFVLDIREGDRFSLIYEEVYRDGEKLRDGEIIVAEFVNRGRPFHAVRFTDDDGRSDYYTPDGLALRKAFLRAPLEFTRVSSRFNPNRRHPVMNTIRAHRGVDYAAPTGTPIRAAGDGRVILRGTNGGYGNAVEIQHGGNISTLYAHMSSFQRGVGVGTRVRQGQVIGYVGMTGLANGPHLHYEFRVNGVHRNPLTVQLPDAEPLPSRYHERFTSYARPLLAHLEALGQPGPRIAAVTGNDPDGG